MLKNQPLTITEIRANPEAAQDAYNADGRVLDKDIGDAIVGWLAARTR